MRERRSTPVLAIVILLLLVVIFAVVVTAVTLSGRSGGEEEELLSPQLAGSITDEGDGSGHHGYEALSVPTFSEAATEAPTAQSAAAPGGMTASPIQGRYYVYPDLTQLSALRNTFVIVAFGNGHGVGMSQWGAVGFAAQGYNYIQILQHYYTGTAIVRENIPPAVTLGSASVPTEEMVARIVEMEIAGCVRENDPGEYEALKAQAVAAYTNIRYYGYKVRGQAYRSSYSACRNDTKQAVKETLGQFLVYNNETCCSYYSSCMAGVTASYAEIWGDMSRDVPYLQSVTSYPDYESPEFINAVAVSPESMRTYINSYDSSIVLGSDPATWLQILEHDDAVNENIGHVLRMRIGDRETGYGAGLLFRDEVMNYDISSPCFAIIYNGNYL